MHSTLTALLETTNNWSINIDNGLLNGVLFIDLKKAFDTIDHEIILRKLANYGVDQSTLRFFASCVVVVVFGGGVFGSQAALLQDVSNTVRSSVVLDRLNQLDRIEVRVEA